MKDAVLDSLNKRGRESKKFVFGLVSLFLNVVVISLAFLVLLRVYGSKPEALDWFAFGGFVAMSLGAINMLPLGYVGSASWQEKGVKIAAMGRREKEEESE